MKKLTLLITAISLALPLYAGAQVKATSTETLASEAQVFTACSQASIEVRDGSIGSARTAYNNAMGVALDARKEAEKKAVALTEASEKKAAIKVAVEDYKKAVTQAQDNLIKARKEAWSTFEDNMKACRDMKEARHDALSSDKKEVKAEAKAATETEKAESKTLKETLREQLENIKSFFKKGASND